jgi:hypothetical protein
MELDGRRTLDLLVICAKYIERFVYSVVTTIMSLQSNHSSGDQYIFPGGLSILLHCAICKLAVCPSKINYACVS